MKRFLVTISVFLAIFSVMYSGIWLYKSKTVKSLTENAILAITKDLGGRKSEFVYANTLVSGFPFGYKVQINKPRFIIDDKNISLELSSDDSLIIESDILESKYTATLPQNINVKNGESLEQNYSLRYNSPAQIELSSNNKNLAARFFKRIIFDDTKGTYEINQANYKDSGYKYINPLNQDVISSAESVDLTVKIVSDSTYNLKANISNQFFKGLKKLADKKNDIGNINLAADIIYSEKSGDSVSFKNFALNSDKFSLDIKGNTSSSNIEAFPYGDLTIKIGSYEDFIDFKANLLNNMVSNSIIPLFRIKSKQITDFKTFLSKVATEKSDDGKNIALTLKREEGQAVSIGKYSFIEAVHIYNGGHIEKVTTNASKEFVTDAK